MSAIPCVTCGSTEYTCHSGYFICNNCDTQSQEIQDQRFEFVDFGRSAEDDEEREEVRSEKSIAERKLTSWECYNIVLRGLVDELIDLGASTKIKVLTLQLWASYLQWSSVAFTSKDEEKLPALSTKFRNKDVETLYGIPNLRKKLFLSSSSRGSRSSKCKRSGSESDSVSGKSSRSLKLKQRKLAMDEIILNNDYSVSEIDTLASLDKERQQQKLKKRNIIFKSSSRKILAEIKKETEKLEDLSSGLSYVKKHQFGMYNRRSKSSRKGPNVQITTVTMITILRLALQLVNDEILLSDILRWICEGRLSVNQPEKFVPSFYLCVRKNDLHSTQRETFQLDMRNFTCHLKLSVIPTPNLFKLAERYCRELCLPNDFLKLVLKLLVDSKVEMDYSKYQFRVFPDYECRIIAFILFVFKLLFSLDDYTEYQQSKFADAVNELQLSESEEKIPTLFSWSKWMRYMECRKAVLSEYSASVCQMAYPNRSCSEGVSLDSWEKVKPTHETTANLINDALLSSLAQEIRSSLYENTSENGRMNIVDYSASLTPFNAHTEHLMKNYSASLSPTSKELLLENFTSHSVKHAMDSEWCSSIAKRFEININLCDQEELFELKIHEKKSNESDDSSYDGICPRTLYRVDKAVNVYVENSLPVNMRDSKTKIVAFCPSICKNESKLPKECEFTTSKIRFPSYYWCFHDCSRRLSNRDFDILAKQNFPSSFLWILCECASMLRINVKELYMELVFVEIVLHRHYDQHSSQNGSLKLHMNEW